MRKKRILSTNDGLSVRKSLKRLLVAFGFDVSVFGSGEDFLKQVLPETSGCLIRDIHMPGMNDLEVQKQLTTMGSHLLTIFITADKNQGVEPCALQAGALAYLQKPFTHERLFESIQSAFAKN